MRSPSPKPTKTIQMKAHFKNGKTVKAHTCQVPVSGPKAMKKSTKKGVKKGPPNKEYKEDKKLAAKLYTDEYFKWHKT